MIKNNIKKNIPIFPLYDELENMKFEENLTWDKIVSLISNFTLVDNEILYSLILHFYTISIKDNDINLSTYLYKLGDPKKIQNLYGCKIFNGGKGVIFTINNLPESLQNIIRNYVQYLTYN